MSFAKMQKSTWNWYVMMYIKPLQVLTITISMKIVRYCRYAVCLRFDFDCHGSFSFFFFVKTFNFILLRLTNLNIFLLHWFSLAPILESFETTNNQISWNSISSSNILAENNKLDFTTGKKKCLKFNGWLTFGCMEQIFDLLNQFFDIIARSLQLFLVRMQWISEIWWILKALCKFQW